MQQAKITTVVSVTVFSYYQIKNLKNEEKNNRGQ